MQLFLMSMVAMVDCGLANLQPLPVASGKDIDDGLHVLVPLAPPSSAAIAGRTSVRRDAPSRRLHFLEQLEECVVRDRAFAEAHLKEKESHTHTQAGSGTELRKRLQGRLGTGRKHTTWR